MRKKAEQAITKAHDATVLAAVEFAFRKCKEGNSLESVVEMAKLILRVKYENPKD